MSDDLKTNPLANTENSLRNLLEKIFATSDIYTFEELIDDIVKCIEFNFDFLVYLRDRSWFQSGYLIFKYLSFYLKDNSTKRFTTRHDVEDLETTLLRNGYRCRESDRCRIIYQVTENVNTERMINLLMRIIVAFYTNCGHQDHVRNSVSQRFIKEYFRENPLNDIEKLKEYIRSRIGLRMTLCVPRDEMYFADTAISSAKDLLRPWTLAEHSIPAEFNDPAFLADLRTSVLRKSQTSGAYTSQDSQYVIRTFCVSRLSGTEPEPWARYKVRQKAVAVFESAGQKRISLDEVYHAGRVVEEFLDALDESRIADLLMNAETDCLNREISMAEQPVATHDELTAALSQTLAPSIETVAQICQISGITLWIYDPFSKSLRVTISRDFSTDYRLESADSISLANDFDHLVTRCFEKKQIFALKHPRHIEGEKSVNTTVERNTEDGRRRLNKLAADEADRKDWRSSGNSQNCSTLVAPVRRRGIVIGVLEVIATEVGELTFDIRLLERLASICAEAIRRIELANDRAWLAKMSFVYACRHRIEELVRELTDKNETAGRELLEMIRGQRPGEQPEADQKMHPNEPTQQNGFTNNHQVDPSITMHENSLSKIIERINRSLANICKGDQLSSWINAVSEQLSRLPQNSQVFECLADITETLVANNSHSPFSLEHYTITCTGDAPNSRCVEVVYEPSDVWIDEDRMNQICVSPIRSRTTITFHYGLFLLSAQVRLLGGVVQTKNVSNEIGCKLFGLIFRLPL